jgi:isopentenyl diphosphate isomerase/L-lactate dehydrogenase-like FMN-dependent dehydrogenase
MGMMTVDLKRILSLAEFEAGVVRALAILREEFEIALALLGAATPDAITRAHVGRASPLPSVP